MASVAGAQPQTRTAAARRLLLTLLTPERRVLGGIAVLALVLRLAHLDLVVLTSREVWHLLEAAQTMRASVGEASTHALSPLAAALLGLPLLLSRDPRWLLATLAATNGLAVAGLALLLRRWYGLGTAVPAALLYATGPWSVMAARSIAAEALLPPLGVGLLAALGLALFARQPWAWAAAPALAGAAVAISPSAWPLGLTVGLLAVTYWRRVALGHLVLGATLGVLLAMPAVLYHATSISAAASRGPLLGAHALALAAQAHSGWRLLGVMGLMGESVPFAATAWRLWDGLAAALFWLSSVAAPFLALRAWSHWRTGRDSALDALPAIWLWAGLLGLSLSRDAAPLAAAMLYPAGYLAVGIVVHRATTALLARRGSFAPLFAALAWLALGVLMGWQALTTVSIQQAPGRLPAAATSVPLRHYLRVASMVRREANQSGIRQVWVLAEGSDPARHEQPALLAHLLSPDVEPVFFGCDGVDALPLPAGRPGLYLLTREPAAAVELLQAYGAQARGEVLLSTGRAGARLYAAEALPVREALGRIPQRTLTSFDVGAVLLGYAWEPLDQGRVRLTTYWTFRDVPPYERIEQHALLGLVLAENGQQSVPFSGWGLEAQQWREGLVLAQWHPLDLEAEVADAGGALALGMVRRRDLERSRVHDHERYDVGDLIVLPLP